MPHGGGSSSSAPADSSSGPAPSGPPSISLPKGGGAIRGIGEKFSANPVTGTGSLTVPIATSPGRSGFGPQLSLSYDSGAGNGLFGLGWSLSLPSITRKTDKGLPRYDDASESDVYILSGAEDLVPVLDDAGEPLKDEDSAPGYTIHRYRPRTEGLFARIERWTDDTSGEMHWRSISRDNITTWYGRDAGTRIADPDDPARVFSWLICSSYDDKGNAIVYVYAAEDSTGVELSRANEANRSDSSRAANCHLERIKYGNRAPNRDEDWKATDPAALTDWMFEVVFDFDDGRYQDLPLDSTVAEANQHRYATATAAELPGWALRPDPFSSYRAGFEVRTYRRYRRVLMFHNFPELPIQPCLVRSTEFDYDDFDYGGPYTPAQEAAHPGSTRTRSIIRSVTQSGYVHAPSATEPLRYLKRSLPPLELEYSVATIDSTVLDVEGTDNLPAGVDGSSYQWVDLDGEGLSGALTEQAGAWFYKRNVSALPVEGENGALVVRARFEPLERVAPLPSATGLLAGRQQFLDLAGDGQVDVAELESPTPGYYERTSDEGWEPFIPFVSLPNLSWKDPNLRFVDLTGDGHADVMITEDEVFAWYPSLGEEGFAAAERVSKALDEEEGPRLVFADGAQSIYLADMSGDGLTDLVRIRNGEVCYWPSLGYCRWGKKVAMDNAPWFDAPAQFDQKRIRLADIDGSGATDIIYLGAHQIDIYRNHVGNGWTDAESLLSFPPIDSLSSVAAVDLLGNGTACLVWNSPLPADASHPMRYIDLMGGAKPHLLVRSTNNLGAETRVRYVASTRFYLQDRIDGKPWITKLPFPVHVVERVENYDHVSRNRSITRYAYHHGYFDGVEREFRGFGRVDQFDTLQSEALAGDVGGPESSNIDPASHVPPVLTRTWFHTGIYLGRDRISNFFAGLLRADDAGEYYREPGLTEDQARQFLLDDTVLPDDLTLEEEREACRALKGSMLRQEVYALDGTGSDEYPNGYPYTVSEQNFGLLRVQGRHDNRHAVFFVHPRETITYRYERSPADPRVVHEMTLEVGEKYGQVLKSLSISYGRRAGLSSLEDEDKTKQERTLAVYSENDFTEAFDKDADDPDYDPDNYRMPLPCESRTYEVTGFELGAGRARFAFDDFAMNRCQILRELQEMAYETAVDYTQQRRRLIEQVRTLYRPDDLGASAGAAATLLPLASSGSLAIPGETYKLAFTQGLLDSVYVRRGQSLLPADADDVLVRGAGVWGGSDGGGYVELDGKWWLPSGRVFFSPDESAAQELSDARAHFFVPRRYRDSFFRPEVPWRTETLVDYDDHDLLVRETRDALGNRVTVGRRNPDETASEDGNDYRVLQARLVMDPNRNCAEAAFDALGLVVGSAVMSKPEDSPVKGDRLGAAFVTDLTQSQISSFYEAANPHTLAPALLGDATTRIVYDLGRFYRSRAANPLDPSRWEPVFAATLARETHVSEGLGTRIQLSFSYSDGFGREIQKKMEAEPGKVPLRDAEGQILVGADGQPQMSVANQSPRWVGTGWTIYNNKGKPVMQFEPYFSDSHQPDFDVRIGVSSVLFYDPVERLIATLHPNHTYEKVVFDSWSQSTYDVSDTVDLDPRTDPHVARYVEEYFAGQPAGWQTWLRERIDPSSPPADSRGAFPERDAAVRALAHADTPTAAHFDSLGRTFLTSTDNRTSTFETRVALDIEGNQREVVDAKGRVVMRYDYDMLGNRVHQASVDAGERWMLNDVTAKSIRAWDGRGHDFIAAYDRLRRPLASWVIGTDTIRSDPRTLATNIAPRTAVLFAKTEYGEGQIGDVALNLRTRVFRLCDGAGVVTNFVQDPGELLGEAYDFKGNLLRSSRRVPTVYRGELIDWATTLPSGDAFDSRTRYDALNRPVALVAPDGSTICPNYNEAGLLDALDVNLRGAVNATPFVTNIDYNAKGQRLQIDYAARDQSGAIRLDGISTTYEYDPATFRLMHLRTRRTAPAFDATDRPGDVQNLFYTYDPAGNITHIRDSAQDTIHFRNHRVEPSNDYTYDSIYRLIEATGREHLGQNGGGSLLPPSAWSYNDRSRIRRPHPEDGAVMGTYRESYAYDEVGNILSMRHRGTDPAQSGWKRCYQYALDSNRLLSTGNSNGAGNPDDPCPVHYAAVPTYPETYSYDQHGNMLRMPQLQSMQWDFLDRLLMTRRQRIAGEEDEDGEQHDGERTYYGYDASGQRVRKVTLLAGSSNTVKDERIYLGGFEVYRSYVTNVLERESLHVMDDKQRIALVETETSDASAQPLTRYQLGNHLGTACLELDDQAQIVSYEEYTPYGSSTYQGLHDIEVPAKRYRYTGKERDEESGLYYHGARYFAPWLARWTSCDPAVFGGAASERANHQPYEYVENKPVAANDPDGRAINFLAAAVGAAVGAVIGGAIEAGRQYVTTGRVSDWGAVGASAAGGAVSGAVAGLTMGASLVVQATAAAASGVAGGATTRALRGEEHTAGAVALDAAIGLATFGVVRGGSAAIGALRGGTRAAATSGTGAATRSGTSAAARTATTETAESTTRATTTATTRSAASTGGRSGASSTARAAASDAVEAARPASPAAPGTRAATSSGSRAAASEVAEGARPSAPSEALQRVELVERMQRIVSESAQVVDDAIARGDRAAMEEFLTPREASRLLAGGRWSAAMRGVFIEWRSRFMFALDDVVQPNVGRGGFVGNRGAVVNGTPRRGFADFFGRDDGLLSNIAIDITSRAGRAAHLMRGYLEKGLILTY